MTTLHKSLRYIITGHNRGWVGFQSAKEAQEYWDKIPKKNKDSGLSRFFFWSGEENMDEDAGLMPISAAFPEVLYSIDPRE